MFLTIPMKNPILLILILVSSHFLVGQTKDIPEINSQKGFIKADFLSINMPITEISKEVNMGFSGIHYLGNIFD